MQPRSRRSSQSSPRSSTLPTSRPPILPSNFHIKPPQPSTVPSVAGLPLKYVSLFTLAVQNASLSIVMHYSRVYIPPATSYSPASAVLLNEILKGSISFMIALANSSNPPSFSRSSNSLSRFLPWSPPFRQLCSDIFSHDCWKLSIPAILYVVQNSLQFVAVSNLPVASFQVAYQMKILTTAAFSVALLRKKLSFTKWLSLFFLAIGVGIVQISTTNPSPPPKDIAVGSAHDSAPLHRHAMRPLTGFVAVAAACFTSGLAGVYFEKVLKNSKADLWVRNVQLSLFSLIPALIPILYSPSPPNSSGFIFDIFRNFGGWAWATVVIQVFGGLITAVVIKYSDNILKGFATSLSIILSFLASVALFDFRITPSFIFGSSIVLAATWMYNLPARVEPLSIVVNDPNGKIRGVAPLSADSVILGEYPRTKKSPFGSPRAIASALGFATSADAKVPDDNGYFSPMWDTAKYHNSPYGSPFPSRTPTPTSAPPSSNGESRRW